MTVKVITFNKATGHSEIACLESQSDFPIQDAIKRLVSDNSLDKIIDEVSCNNKHHLYVYESEYWKVILTI